jgi:hypothetical protein
VPAESGKSKVYRFKLAMKVAMRLPRPHLAIKQKAEPDEPWWEGVQSGWQRAEF